MKFDNIIKYALHDTEISKVVYNNNFKITFCFKTGIYLLNQIGKEAEKTQQCVLDIFLRSNADPCLNFIEVKKFYKSRHKDIEFKDFIKLIEKNCFEVISEYYSFFDNSILLKGFIGKYGIELIISEIENITYSF